MKRPERKIDKLKRRYTSESVYRCVANVEEPVVADLETNSWRWGHDEIGRVGRHQKARAEEAIFRRIRRECYVYRARGMIKVNFNFVPTKEWNPPLQTTW